MIATNAAPSHSNQSCSVTFSTTYYSVTPTRPHRTRDGRHLRVTTCRIKLLCTKDGETGCQEIGLICTHVGQYKVNFFAPPAKGCLIIWALPCSGFIIISRPFAGHHVRIGLFGPVDSCDKRTHFPGVKKTEIETTLGNNIQVSVCSGLTKHQLAFSCAQ